VNASVCLSVVSHGQSAILRGLLDDLVLLRPPSLKRVIITCNVPETIAIPPAPPFLVEIVNNTVPTGFGRNHNAAFARGSEPYFTVCNPDIRLEQDPFPVLLDALDTGRALSAPAVVNPCGELEDSARRLLTPSDVLMRRFAHRRVNFERPAWLAGMFLVFRSAAFRQLGGFDEKFFMYCEDADICARAVLEGGGFALCPEVTVVHDARRASRRAFRPLRWHVASLLKFWLSPTFWAYRRYLRSDNVQPTVFRSESP
jgi:N-acetylglucosaminyl-diphospho-decaprenol L-rhamnosyltransferase